MEDPYLNLAIDLLPASADPHARVAAHLAVEHLLELHE